jgi:hypothetical protein
VYTNCLYKPEPRVTKGVDLTVKESKKDLVDIYLFSYFCRKIFKYQERTQKIAHLFLIHVKCSNSISHAGKKFTSREMARFYGDGWDRKEMGGGWNRELGHFYGDGWDREMGWFLWRWVDFIELGGIGRWVDFMKMCGIGKWVVFKEIGGIGRWGGLYGDGWDSEMGWFLWRWVDFLEICGIRRWVIFMENGGIGKWVVLWRWVG